MIKIQLSRLLGDRRMKQSELSRLTEIRPNTINELYHEKSDSIKFDHLDRICGVLDCDLNDLIIYTPNSILKIAENSTL